jgi:selT/selW/selH-like putative selenoprotein
VRAGVILKVMGRMAQNDTEEGVLHKEHDMTVSIEYCGTCNYRPMAASLAMAIKAGTGLTVQLIHSREIGAFEVTFNGESIYSKKKAGHFPDHEKIVEDIKRRQGGSA